MNVVELPRVADIRSPGSFVGASEAQEIRSPTVLIGSKPVESPRLPSVVCLNAIKQQQQQQQADTKLEGDKQPPSSANHSERVVGEKTAPQLSSGFTTITSHDHSLSSQHSYSDKQQHLDKFQLAKQSDGHQDDAKIRAIGTRRHEAPFMFAGILGSLLGSIFFSIAVLCIKLLPDAPGLAEKTKIVLCRGIIMFFLSGATIIYQKSSFLVKRDELWLNILRSVFGFSGVFGSYVALKYISIGDSTALVFSSTIWTSILSHFILNEPLRVIQLLALPASLVGIVLIAHPALIVNMDQEAGPLEKEPEVLGESSLSAPLLLAQQLNSTILSNSNATGPDFDIDIATNSGEAFDFSHRWPGIVISLITSLVVSCVYIVLKFRKSTPIQTTTFWLACTTVIGALLVHSIIGFGKMPASLYEWLLILAIGCLSWLGQVMIQWSLYYEDASVLSVVRTFDVALTFALSALFLDEAILWTSVLGGAIISLVVISIILNNWIANKLCPSKAPDDGERDEPLHSKGALALRMGDDHMAPEEHLADLTPLPTPPPAPPLPSQKRLGSPFGAKETKAKARKTKEVLA